jgi:phosphohistidine phosphatase
VRVFLVRHADAERGEPDELRVLSAKGREQSRRLAEQFAAEGVRPTAVLTSPLVRARETADAIARATGTRAEPVERLAPGATVDDLLAAVAGRDEPIVVVGHQPDCGRIVATLTGDEPAFPTAGVCVVDLP